MKGITATQVIVALAVGLIVIIGLGYLVWNYLGLGGGQVNEKFCRAKELEYCTRYSMNGYTDDMGGFLNYAPRCQGFDWASEVWEGSCKELLGQKEHETTTT